MSKLKAYRSGVINIGIGKGNGDTSLNKNKDDVGKKEDIDIDNTSISGTIVHNFSEDGLNSSFFNINGNLSTTKGSLNLNGLNFNTCLKLESSTSITFTVNSSVKLTLFTDTTTTNFKLDGNKINTESNGITVVEIDVGSHEITKADSGNIFMLIISSLK